MPKRRLPAETVAVGIEPPAVTPIAPQAPTLAELAELRAKAEAEIKRNAETDAALEGMTADEAVDIIVSETDRALSQHIKPKGTKKAKKAK
jgi:hypothetical protein